jgi:dipeptidyl aminopeptidase/acylaminoacyl peptidase
MQMRFLCFWLVCLGGLLSALPGSAQTTAKPPASRPTASFYKDVLPILRTACIGCHGGAQPAGKLALTSYANLMQGGKSGSVLVAGKSGDSRLVKLLLGTEQPRMPPGGPLSSADIERIRQWIDAGAKADTPVEERGGKPGPANALKISAAASRTLPSPTRALPPRRNIPTPVTALAFSPDGRSLAVGTYQEVQIWDVTTRQRSRIWGGQADSVHALVFSKDGKELLAGGGTPGFSGEVRLLDVASGQEKWAVGEHTDAVYSLALSPDGTQFASGSADKTIRLWEFASGKPLQVLREHSDAVWGLAYSPDGKYLASSSADHSVKVWDMATHKRLYSIDAHDDIVYDVEFSPNGKNLVTASADGSAKVWAFGPDGSGFVYSLKGDDLPVHAATFSSDGQNIATASADRSVKLWKQADGKNLSTLSDAKDWVYAVRFSPDHKHLAAGAWDGTVLLWSVPDGKLEGVFSTQHP